MPYDAAATRRRILDAAVAEFSTHGIAGARVDRIAAASASNKSLIYAYFGSKDELFDAVFDAIVVQTVRDVPIDADDLPGYAARLFDQHAKHPEPLRVGTWDALERAGRGMAADAVRDATQEKVDAIAAAQRRGVVSARLPAEALLTMIIALSRVVTPVTGRARTARRAAVRTAVDRLSAVG